MDAAAEPGKNPVSKHQIQPEYGDEQAEPVSRDQILSHARGQGNIIFPVQLTTSRIGNRTPVDPYSAICDDYTYIYELNSTSRSTREKNG